MKFWETEVDINSRKVLVIPNITNSQNIEKDSFVDVIYNHILGLKEHGSYFWHIILPQPVKKLNLENVKQHILPFSGDMIKMRTYPPDMNRLLETLEYDSIYSHLPDWPQVGRYKNSFDTKIIGYCHWWEMKTCNAEDRKNKWRWMPIELLGVSQMETCFLNTQEQKDRVLAEAKMWFNDEFVSNLDKILTVWNLGIEESKIIEVPTQKEKIIVFNHRAAAYKGYPKFIELMKEYRERRQDFKVWVPQLDGKPEASWIDNTKVAKHDYYKKLQSCTVGIQMRQTNYGWSVAATDCMMNGTPMIFQESECYKEIDPNGLFFKFKKDLFEMLDKLLDDEGYSTEQSVRSIDRANELSLNDKKMFEVLSKKL
jgi:glycosyltransferase involved in cell wall biosynthesis